MYYFVDNGSKITALMWLIAEGIVRDHVSFQFLISCHVPEIFLIIGSCVKSAEILHVFGTLFREDSHPDFWTCITKSTVIVITWQRFTAIARRSSEILWRTE